MHLTECDHAAVCIELCVATQLLVLHPDCAGPGDEIVLSQLLKIGLGVWFSFPHWLALSKSLSDINSLPPCSVLNNVHSLLENHKPSNASESSFLFFSNFHSHFTNPIYQKHIKSNTLTYLFINTLPLPSSPASIMSSPDSAIFSYLCQVFSLPFQLSESLPPMPVHFPNILDARLRDSSVGKRIALDPT